jgi:diadenosine tetraphosphate (Ap4A) HIT family hydrolase
MYYPAAMRLSDSTEPFYPCLSVFIRSPKLAALMPSQHIPPWTPVRGKENFPAASPRLPPCLRASASKSSAPLTRPSPQVSHPIPPRLRPRHELSGNLVNPSTIDYRQTVSYSIGLLTCPYCSVSPEDAWVFTDFVTAKPHPSPLASCHLVVAPRRHVAAFYDLDVQEQRMIWDAVAQLCRRIATSIPVEGFAAGFVDSPLGDEPGFHAYVHLVPRVPGKRPDLPCDAEWVDLGPQP